MIITAKRFQELSTAELYEILKLRVSVFVVEQNCPYMELDDRDQEAIHVIMRDDDGRLAAYMRVLDRGSMSEHCAIGRVIAVQRRCGHASELLQAGLKIAETEFGADKVYVEAQTYARGLYEKRGFIPCGEEFLEDGIPHIPMLLEI